MRGLSSAGAGSQKVSSKSGVDPVQHKSFHRCRRRKVSQPEIRDRPCPVQLEEFELLNETKAGIPTLANPELGSIREEFCSADIVEATLRQGLVLRLDLGRELAILDDSQYWNSECLKIMAVMRDSFGCV